MPIRWACSSAPWARSRPSIRTPRDIFSEESRRLQTLRLIAKVPSIAAYAFRHSIGRPFNQPDNDLSYAGNFLNMLFRMTELKYNAAPGARAGARRALHPARRPRAELQHAASMRAIGSSHADPYSALAGAAAALYGPLHGGANEAVLRMLHEIGSMQQHPGASSSG